MMLVLVTYDVATSAPGGVKRLSRVAKVCLDYGQRVQNSVFECHVDQTQWTDLLHRLLRIIDPGNDSLRCYFLGANWEQRVEHYGAKATVNLRGPLVL